MSASNYNDMDSNISVIFEEISDALSIVEKQLYLISNDVKENPNNFRNRILKIGKAVSSKNSTLEKQISTLLKSNNLDTGFVQETLQSMQNTLGEHDVVTMKNEEVKQQIDELTDIAYSQNSNIDQLREALKRSLSLSTNSMTVHPQSVNQSNSFEFEQPPTPNSNQQNNSTSNPSKAPAINYLHSENIMEVKRKEDTQNYNKNQTKLPLLVQTSKALIGTLDDDGDDVFDDNFSILSSESQNSRIIDLENRIRNSNKQNIELKNQLKSQRLAYQDLSEKSKQTFISNNELKNQVATLNSEKEKLEKNFLVAKKKIAQLQMKLKEKAKLSISNPNLEYFSDDTEVQKFEKERKEVDSILQTLGAGNIGQNGPESIQDIATRLKNLVAMRNSLQKEIEQRENELKKLKNHRQILEEAIKSIISTVNPKIPYNPTDSSCDPPEQLIKDIQELVKEKNKYQTENENLLEVQVQVTTERDQLSLDKKNSIDKLTQLAKFLNHESNDEVNESDLLNALEAQIQAMNQLLPSTTGDPNEPIPNRLNKLLNEYNKLKESVSSLSSTIDPSTGKTTDVSEMIENLRNKIKQNQEDEEAMTSLLSPTIEKLEDDPNNHESKIIRAIKQLLNDLQNQKESSQKIISDLADSLNIKLDPNQDMEQLKSTLQNEISKQAEESSKGNPKEIKDILDQYQDNEFIKQIQAENENGEFNIADAFNKLCEKYSNLEKSGKESRRKLNEILGGSPSEDLTDEEIENKIRKMAQEYSSILKMLGIKDPSERPDDSDLMQIGEGNITEQVRKLYDENKRLNELLTLNQPFNQNLLSMDPTQLAEANNELSQGLKRLNIDIDNLPEGETLNTALLKGLEKIQNDQQEMEDKLSSVSSEKDKLDNTVKIIKSILKGANEDFDENAPLDPSQLEQMLTELKTLVASKEKLEKEVEEKEEEVEKEGKQLKNDKRNMSEIQSILNSYKNSNPDDENIINDDEFNLVEQIKQLCEEKEKLKHSKNEILKVLKISGNISDDQIIDHARQIAENQEHDENVAELAQLLNIPQEENETDHELIAKILAKIKSNPQSLIAERAVDLNLSDTDEYPEETPEAFEALKKENKALKQELRKQKEALRSIQSMIYPDRQEGSLDTPPETLISDIQKRIGNANNSNSIDPNSPNQPNSSFVPGSNDPNSQNQPNSAFVPGSNDPNSPLYANSAFVPGSNDPNSPNYINSNDPNSQNHPNSAFVPGSNDPNSQNHPNSAFVPGSNDPNSPLNANSSFVPGSNNENQSLYPGASGGNSSSVPGANNMNSPLSQGSSNPSLLNERNASLVTDSSILQENEELREKLKKAETEIHSLNEKVIEGQSRVSGILEERESVSSLIQDLTQTLKKRMANPDQNESSEDSVVFQKLTDISNALSEQNAMLTSLQDEKLKGLQNSSNSSPSDHFRYSSSAYSSRADQNIDKIMSILDIPPPSVSPEATPEEIRCEKTSSIVVKVHHMRGKTSVPNDPYGFPELNQSTSDMYNSIMANDQSEQSALIEEEEEEFDANDPPTYSRDRNQQHSSMQPRALQEILNKKNEMIQNHMNAFRTIASSLRINTEQYENDSQLIDDVIRHVKRLTGDTGSSDEPASMSSEPLPSDHTPRRHNEEEEVPENQKKFNLKPLKLDKLNLKGISHVDESNQRPQLTRLNLNGEDNENENDEENENISEGYGENEENASTAGGRRRNEHNQAHLIDDDLVIQKLNDISSDLSEQQKILKQMEASHKSTSQYRDLEKSLADQQGHWNELRRALGLPEVEEGADEEEEDVTDIQNRMLEKIKELSALHEAAESDQEASPNSPQSPRSTTSEQPPTELENAQIKELTDLLTIANKTIQTYKDEKENILKIIESEKQTSSAVPETPIETVELEPLSEKLDELQTHISENIEVIKNITNEKHGQSKDKKSKSKTTTTNNNNNNSGGAGAGNENGSTNENTLTIMNDNSPLSPISTINTKTVNNLNEEVERLTEENNEKDRQIEDLSQKVNGLNLIIIELKDKNTKMINENAKLLGHKGTQSTTSTTTAATATTEATTAAETATTAAETATTAAETATTKTTAAEATTTEAATTTAAGTKTTAAGTKTTAAGTKTKTTAAETATTTTEANQDAENIDNNEVNNDGVLIEEEEEEVDMGFVSTLKEEVDRLRALIDSTTVSITELNYKRSEIMKSQIPATTTKTTKDKQQEKGKAKEKEIELKSGDNQAGNSTHHLMNSLDSLDSQMNQSTKEINQAINDNDSFEFDAKGQASPVNNVLDSLRIQMNNLKKSNREKDQRIKELEAQNKALQQEREAFLAQNGLDENNNSNASIETDQENEQIQKMSQELADQCNEIEKLKKLLDQTKKELRAMREDRDSIMKSIFPDFVPSSYNDDDNISQLLSNLTDLDNQVSQQTDELKSSTDFQGDEVDQNKLRIIVPTSRPRRNVEKSPRTQITEAFDQMKKQILELSERNNELEIKLNEANATIEHLRSEKEMFLLSLGSDDTIHKNDKSNELFKKLNFLDSQISTQSAEIGDAINTSKFDNDYESGSSSPLTSPKSTRHNRNVRSNRSIAKEQFTIALEEMRLKITQLTRENIDKDNRINELEEQLEEIENDPVNGHKNSFFSENKKQRETISKLMEERSKICELLGVNDSYDDVENSSLFNAISDLKKGQIQDRHVQLNFGANDDDQRKPLNKAVRRLSNAFDRTDVDVDVNISIDDDEEKGQETIQDLRNQVEALTKARESIASLLSEVSKRAVNLVKQISTLKSHEKGKNKSKNQLAQLQELEQSALDFNAKLQSSKSEFNLNLSDSEEKADVKELELKVQSMQEENEKLKEELNDAQMKLEAVKVSKEVISELAYFEKRDPESQSSESSVSKAKPGKARSKEEEEEDEIDKSKQIEMLQQKIESLTKARESITKLFMEVSRQARSLVEEIKVLKSEQKSSNRSHDSALESIENSAHSMVKSNEEKQQQQQNEERLQSLQSELSLAQQKIKDLTAKLAKSQEGEEKGKAKDKMIASMRSPINRQLETLRKELVVSDINSSLSISTAASPNKNESKEDDSEKINRLQKQVESLQKARASMTELFNEVSRRSQLLVKQMEEVKSHKKDKNKENQKMDKLETEIKGLYEAQTAIQNVIESENNRPEQERALKSISSAATSANDNSGKELLKRQVSILNEKVGKLESSLQAAENRNIELVKKLDLSEKKLASIEESDPAMSNFIKIVSSLVENDENGSENEKEDSATLQEKLDNLQEARQSLGNLFDRLAQCSQTLSKSISTLKSENPNSKEISVLEMNANALNSSLNREAKLTELTKKSAEYQKRIAELESIIQNGGENKPVIVNRSINLNGNENENNYEQLQNQINQIEAVLNDEDVISEYPLVQELISRLTQSNPHGHRKRLSPPPSPNSIFSTASTSDSILKQLKSAKSEIQNLKQQLANVSEFANEREDIVSIVHGETDNVDTKSSPLVHSVMQLYNIAHVPITEIDQLKKELALLKDERAAIEAVLSGKPISEVNKSLTQKVSMATKSKENDSILSSERIEDEVAESTLVNQIADLMKKSSKEITKDADIINNSGLNEDESLKAQIFELSKQNELKRLELSQISAMLNGNDDINGDNFDLNASLDENIVQKLRDTLTSYKNDSRDKLVKEINSLKGQIEKSSNAQLLNTLKQQVADLDEQNNELTEKLEKLSKERASIQAVANGKGPTIRTQLVDQIWTIVQNAEDSSALIIPSTDLKSSNNNNNNNNTSSKNVPIISNSSLIQQVKEMNKDNNNLNDNDEFNLAGIHGSSSNSSLNDELTDENHVDVDSISSIRSSSEQAGNGNVNIKALTAQNESLRQKLSENKELINIYAHQFSKIEKFLKLKPVGMIAQRAKSIALKINEERKLLQTYEEANNKLKAKYMKAKKKIIQYQQQNPNAINEGENSSLSVGFPNAENNNEQLEDYRAKLSNYVMSMKSKFLSLVDADKNNALTDANQLFTELELAIHMADNNENNNDFDDQ